MDVRIEKGWKKVLQPIFETDGFKSLVQFVKNDYADRSITVYPPASQIFRAFDLCPLDNTKVIIVGQDPYHNPGQANGLSFSVADGIPFPPSLLNIFKEVAADTGATIPSSGDLSRWARQGVLLLNSSLTVREHVPKSHSGIGWEVFTDYVISVLNDYRDNLVFILWGADAIRKGSRIDRNRHLVLTSPHPSPLSAYRGFFGNHHFSRTNEYLSAHGIQPVIW
ncbi:MAG: uracil-DNA glycosylase [Prevotella sp.]|nr:uracil-DNA glycosylase [Bacteroides sp.]MCM1367072.1 uracil-DNA glycosylase [Prevotella sp.]MCM1437546.1 uracil-DNA glycosylase [Prevotella sp.]